MSFNGFLMFIRRSIAFAAACAVTVAFADETPVSGTVSQRESERANVLLTSPVVVTATRIEQNSFDLPVSIDVVDAEKIQEGQLQVNISESLIRVPGIIAQSRGQFAQDIQISSRGFGARSQFGVRGIRLYADGIPLTMPDGQGQAGTFDLGSAKSIEVMRGPFSALYGNSSGGVIQIFTADGPKDPTLSGSLTTGSYGTNRESVKLGGTDGAFNYIADYSHLESDGYRDHSAVRRDLFNTKFGIQLREDTRLTVIATYLDQPLAQDPQGLTKALWQQNPKQVVTNTNTFNTRVERSHTQAGAKLEHDIDTDNTFSLMGYGGTRDNLQYQSIGAAQNGIAINIPTGSTATKVKFPSSSSLTSGGVAQIDRDFGGMDLRYTHKGEFVGGPYNFSLGTNFDTMDDHRTGYDNFVPVPGTLATNITCGSGIICGVKGTLRRDENDTAWNFDQYAQAEWSLQPRWSLTAGIRHSDVHIKSEDHYLSNGNDGGSTSFTKTTPVAGVVFKVTPTFNLYANAGKGFETPTLIEMAYKPVSGTFNFNLQPATSNNYEIGAKAFLGLNTRANIAIFKTDTQNEIVVASSVSGRSTYQNAGGTERTGAELSIDSDIGNGFAAYASYSYLDATYSDRFCSGSTSATCAGGTLVNSGKVIPGTYRQTAYAEISWKYAPIGFSTAIETRANSKVYVSDTNTDAAPGYTIVNWRGGFAQNLNQWRVTEFVRVENLLARNYIGSVKINDSNSQFYEPGAGRNWLLGLNASYQF